MRRAGPDSLKKFLKTQRSIRRTVLFLDRLSESWFRKIRISQRLLITFILLTLVPLCIVGLVSINLSTMALQENISNYLFQILTQVTYNFTAELNKLEALSMEFMTSDQMRDFDNSIRNQSNPNKLAALGRLEQLFQSKVSGSRDFGSIAFYPLNFPMVARTDILINAANQDKSGIFQRVMASTGYPIWIYMKNKETDLGLETNRDVQPTLKIGVPVLFRKISSMYDGNPLGVLHIAPRREVLRKICSEVEIGKKGQIILCDAGNRIITCNEGNLIGSYLYPELSGKLNQSFAEKGSFFTEIHQTKMLVCYSVIPDYNWKVVSIVPFKNLSARIREIGVYVMMMMGICILISLIISYLVTRSVSLPINQINKSFEYLGRGDFTRKLELRYQDELTDLASGFNKMTEDMRHLISEVYLIKIEKLNSDFKALQAQINPHFLYNTLESINSLALIKKEWEIAEMVRGLAAVFRYITKNDGASIILKDEIEHVRLYILLQAVRYEGRITMEYQVPEELLQAMVLKFMLQPLVENAIIHGLEKANRKGIIRINVQEKDGQLLIMVSDNGLGMDENQLREIRSKLEGKQEDRMDSVQGNASIGLLNIQLRIKLQFGEGYGLSINSVNGNGTDVTIRIPLIT